MCPTAIIFEDLRTNNYRADLEPGEELEFLDYCSNAICGEAIFSGPDEPAPYEATQ